jgi:metal-responsive CopG/Arc/MetJ family transcriptional regulator
MAKARKNRGAFRKQDCTFIGAWVPTAMVEALDKAVTVLDSDRSKLIREALRDAISRKAATDHTH